MKIAPVPPFRSIGEVAGEVLKKAAAVYGRQRGVDALFEKLRDFYWVPVAAPFGRARGPFRWAGPDAGPLAHRHPTRDEFAHFLAMFEDYGRHFPRDTSAANRYLAMRMTRKQQETAAQ